VRRLRARVLCQQRVAHIVAHAAEAAAFVEGRVNPLVVRLRVVARTALGGFGADDIHAVADARHGHIRVLAPFRASRVYHAVAVVALDALEVVVFEVGAVVRGGASFQPRARRVAAPAELSHARRILLGNRERGAEYWVARRLRHHPAHPLEVRLVIGGEVRVGSLEGIGVVSVLTIAVTVGA
jgi:hypothetical protein